MHSATAWQAIVDSMKTETPESVLEALVRISPAAIIGLNAQKRIDLWSTAAAALFAWTSAEIVGKPLPAGLGLGIEWTQASHPLTVAARARDGRVVEIELRSTGRPEGGWLLMASDLTLTARTERDANIRIKAESRFRELLEAAPDAIMEVDCEGRIVLLNAATESIFGYGREDLLGQRVEMLFPKARAGATKPIARATGRTR